MSERKSKPKITLNEKIEKLDKEVEWFYSEDFKLEEATDKYKAAIKIAQDIEKDLCNLRTEIEVLTADFSNF